ncbi:unnamed protein product [Ceutorhynchus assimilis]|uniref:Uncharacterized protein n=1 Tax=Ceutorhynchus assimilis TaxID=467358 RepID=A0A9N9MZ20_9CUCU|nr:unnamed protein product [Ceutorhynchus assimilis]
MTNISIFYIYYVAVVFEVQLIILMDYLRNLSLEGPIDDELIKRHLVVVIEKHHALMRCYQKVRDLLYVPSIWIALSGIVIVTCFSFLIVSSTFGFFSTYCNFFGMIVTVSFICHEVQTLEDMSGDFSKALYDTKWYLWNQNNRKTFAIFSIVASKPLLWNLTFETKINHGYLRKILGLIYTIENFLRSFST